MAGSLVSLHAWVGVLVMEQVWVGWVRRSRLLAMVGVLLRTGSGYFISVVLYKVRGLCIGGYCIQLGRNGVGVTGISSQAGSWSEQVHAQAVAAGINVVAKVLGIISLSELGATSRLDEQLR